MQSLQLFVTGKTLRMVNKSLVSETCWDLHWTHTDIMIWCVPVNSITLKKLKKNKKSTPEHLASVIPQYVTIFFKNPDKQGLCKTITSSL